MKCLSRPLLLQYRDKELSQAEVQKVSEHLRLCKKCREALDLLNNRIKFVQSKLVIPDIDIMEVPEFQYKRNNSRACFQMVGNAPVRQATELGQNPFDLG